MTAWSQRGMSYCYFLILNVLYGLVLCYKTNSLACTFLWLFSWPWFCGIFFIRFIFLLFYVRLLHYFLHNLGSSFSHDLKKKLLAAVSIKIAKIFPLSHSIQFDQFYLTFCPFSFPPSIICWFTFVLFKLLDDSSNISLVLSSFLLQKYIF